MSKRCLSEWLAYLEQLHPSAIDMGLERSKAVLQRLNLGALAPRIVTVTGTNGKGSTCAFIASLLGAQGLRVGVYSSPHLLRYNERVQILGAEASDAELCEAFEAVEAARGEVSLTYFEMGTLAAFWLFKRAGLDALVLEVGLGGRLDAVNLVDADVAVVTSIGIDHSDWLGDSRESVAFEKAGILRAAKPAVCGDLDPPQPLLEQAQLLNCPLLLRGRDYQLSVAAHGWGWHGCGALGEALSLEQIPLLDLPMENAALALQVYAALGLPWQTEVIVPALLATRLSGRLDRRAVSWQGKQLTILLDVGHNPHAVSYLAQRLAARPLARKRRAVFALLSDKDLTGVVTPLLAEVSEWAVAPLPTSRSMPAAELQSCLQALAASVAVYDTVKAALEAQLDGAEDGDEVLLFGSFYCVAEALEWLSHKADGSVKDGFAG